MNKVTKLIVETFEKEQPSLCLAIKQAVSVGESRPNFEAFLRKVCGADYKISITYSASLTVYDYYKSQSARI